MRRPRIAWVLGWAIPASWFRPMAEAALPEAEHLLFDAGPAIWNELHAAGCLDWVVGYSLGSLLLLQNPAAAAALGRVALLAPIWAFPTEAGAGGRIAGANLRALQRAYRKHPAAALEGFYRTAGLGNPSEKFPNFYPALAAEHSELHLWGLEQLDRGALSPQLPNGWAAWCGQSDSLLDAEALRSLVPSLRIVPSATHHPAKLITAYTADAGSLLF